jgi:hypothetical protein
MQTILYERADPDRSYLTEISRDEETGLPLIYQKQDVRPIVEDAKRYASIFDPHQARKQHWRQVAVIPNVVWAKLMAMGITKDRKALLKWLSRRDARYFRTDSGRRLI